MPLGMANDIKDLGIESKTIFILSGMNSSSYIEEWRDIYYQISHFVYTMYKERMMIYDEMG